MDQMISGSDGCLKAHIKQASEMESWGSNGIRAAPARIDRTRPLCSVQASC